MKLSKNYTLDIASFFFKGLGRYFLLFFIVFSSNHLLGQITIANQEYCGPGSVTFISNDLGCDLYEWTFENDNEVINTGCTFTTPEIALDRSYKVSNGVRDVIVQAMDTCVSNSCNMSDDLVFNIDFGSGTDNGPALPAGVTQFNFNVNAPNVGNQLGASEYAIVSTTAGLNGGWWGNSGSQEILDNTPGDVNGKMLVVNASNDAAEFYRVPVSGVCPSSFYVFSASFINVLRAVGSPCGNAEVPFDVNFRIEDNAGNILGSKATGQTFGSATLPTWTPIDFKFYIPSNVTEIELVLVNNVGGSCGNDLAIDDIQLQQCQPDFVVLSTDDVCSGSGTTLRSSTGPELSTSLLRWQKSTDGGIVWTDVPGATADTLFIPSTEVNITDLYRLSATNQINFNTVGCILFTEPISLRTVELPSLNFDELSLCSGEASFDASFTIDGETPDIFGINWNTAANNSGLADVPFGAPLPVGSLLINGFGAVAAGTYEGNFIIENTTSGCRDSVPLSVSVGQKPELTQYACGGFEAVEASDFGFANNTSGNSGTADISAKFGLEPGSIIVEVSNISVRNAGGFLSPNGGIANKATFTFSGTRAVKTKATHRPFQSTGGTESTDGIISEDLIPYEFTGNLVSPFTANSEGNQYFVPNNTGGGANVGTQTWESSDFTTGISFFAVGSSVRNGISLELCPQVALEACDGLVLPEISGNNLSSPFYYSAPNQGGTRFSQNDTISTDGTYYVFSEIDGCVDEGSFTVEILNTPEFNIDPELTACDNLVLEPISGTNLSSDLTYFTGANGGLPSLAVGDNVTSSTKLYVFDQAIGQSIVCAAQDSVEVEILTRPTLEPLTDTTVCGSYVLEEILGTNLTPDRSYFQSPNGGLPQFQPNDQITSTTTLYAFDEVGSGLSCSSEQAITITVSEGPVLDLVDDLSACDEYVLPLIEGSNLTSSKGYYTMPNGSGSSLAEGSTINQSQTVYVYDSGNNIEGCAAETSFLVTVLTRPTLEPLTDTTVCGSYVLEEILGTNLTPDRSYFQSPNGGLPQFQPNDQITSTTTLYAFDEVGSGLSCSSEQAITITVSEGPVLSLIDDQTACDEYTLPSIKGSNLSFSKGYYTMPNGSGSSLAEGSTINQSQTVYAYDPGNNIEGCAAEVSFLVTVLETPIISDLSQDMTICDNRTALVSISNTSADQVTWFRVTGSSAQPLSNVSPLEVNQSGRYYAVLGNGSCLATSDTVDVDFVDVSILAYADPLEIFVGETSDLTTIGTNADSIIWVNLTDNSVLFGDRQTVSPDRTTTYTIIGTSLSGCVDSTNIQIKVLSPLAAPNVFTPNGDGQNDTFEIQGIEFLADASVKIFNRWGRIVYKTSNYPANEWAGQDAPDGAYYYIIEFEEKNEVKSHTGVVHVVH